MISLPLISKIKIELVEGSIEKLGLFLKKLVKMDCFQKYYYQSVSLSHSLRGDLGDECLIIV